MLGWYYTSYSPCGYNQCQGDIIQVLWYCYPSQQGRYKGVITPCIANQGSNL